MKIESTFLTSQSHFWNQRLLAGFDSFLAVIWDNLIHSEKEELLVSDKYSSLEKSFVKNVQ